MRHQELIKSQTQTTLGWAGTYCPLLLHFLQCHETAGLNTKVANLVRGQEGGKTNDTENFAYV